MNLLIAVVVALMLIVGASVLDRQHHAMYATKPPCDPHCSICPGTYYDDYSGVCDWTRDPI